MSKAKHAVSTLSTVSIQELENLSPNQLSEYIFQNFSLEKILQCLQLTRQQMESVAATVQGVSLAAPPFAQSSVVGKKPAPPPPPRRTTSLMTQSIRNAEGEGIGAGVVSPSSLVPCEDCGTPCASGRCRQCELDYEVLFGRIQKVAANKNIYLTTARDTKDGMKYLGYKFGARGTSKWEMKYGKPVGRWMTEKQILGSSFGTSCNVSQEGYVNFFKLNNLYPKTKEGDIPLIRMNPMMFGYVKQAQKQLYPLGKNAFFKGVHKGITSNLSDLESRQIVGFGPKRRSCFGTTPNEWIQTKTGYGDAEVGMIPFNVLGFRGTQGPYTGVTGAVGYPSKGAAAPLPSFGKKKRRWIQKARRRMETKGTVGTLRAYVRRVLGENAFTQRGTIKKAVLRDLQRNPPNQGIARKVNFAINVGSSLKKRKLPTDSERKSTRGTPDGKRVQFDAFGRKRSVVTKQNKRVRGGRKASYGKKR